MSTLLNEIVIRVLKCVDISLLGCYYLILGVSAALIINKLLEEKETNIEKTSTSKLLLIVFLNTSLIMIAAYFMRKIVEIIPFPLNGIMGYDHGRIKEIKGGVIIAFSIMCFQTNFKDVLKHLVYDRFKMSK